MNTIMLYVSGGIILLIVCVLYVWLVGNILPRVLLKLKFNSNLSTDRGLHTYTYPDGRAVIYEPHPVYRKHIKLYMLHTSGGFKYIRCKRAPQTLSAIYDVYMFDNKNHVIDVIRINEKYSSAESCGKSVQIHEDTSYVKIILRRVNNTIIKTGDVAYVMKKRVNYLYLASCALGVIVFLAIRFALLKLLEEIGAFAVISCPLILAPIGGIVFGLLIARSAVKATSSKGIEVRHYEK